MGEDEKRKMSPMDFIKVRTESGSEDIHYSAFYQGIPEEYKNLARDEINETDENKRNGLKKLKAFAKKENLNCTDEILMPILRACKYNLKKSEKKLRKFSALRTQLIKMAANADDEKINLVLDDMIVGLLPYRDKHGRAIIFSRPNIHLDVYDAEDVDVVIFAFLLYISCSFPLNSVAGICYIGECESENLYVFYPILNQFRKSYINYLLDSPIRLARIDVVNENFLVRLFYNVIRPIVPEKIRKRIFLNGKGYGNLHKIYHPDMLPEEFGGNLGPINNKYFKEIILNYLEKLKAENESLQHSESPDIMLS